jgi:hypothetical protein
MRRILLVLGIVVVLGGIAGGTWLYFRQNSPARLLQKAELARIATKNYEDRKSTRLNSSHH